MKRIFKIVPCILLSALTLVSACACAGGVSDVRRRARKMHDRLAPQQEQILHEDELDPDFLVDMQTEDAEKEPENPDKEECPNCPKESEQHKFHPYHGKRPHRHGRRKHIKPVPYPVPEEDEEN